MQRQAAVEHGVRLYRAGADLIDVGGESTRPGAEPVHARVEQDRVLEVISGLVAHDIPVSIDTRWSSTARLAIEAGATVINDVSGGLHDPAMIETVAEAGCQYVIGHMRGTPQTMADLAEYDDITAEVSQELQDRCAAAIAMGVEPESIVIDPGLGFAKSTEHNWDLIRHLPALSRLGYPLMVGVSRKRFLGDLLPSEAPVTDRDFPSAVLSAIFAFQGIAAVRVHNVASTQLALSIVDRVKG